MLAKMPPKGVKLCREFGKPGSQCKFGNTCTFWHDKTSIKPGDNRCFNCSGEGHTKAECIWPGGGKHRKEKKGEKGGKSSGKGDAGKGQKTDGKGGQAAGATGATSGGRLADCRHTAVGSLALSEYVSITQSD